jgi:hypothetical protein
VGKLRAFVQRLSHELPFRLSTKIAVKRFSTSVRTKGCWDVAVRPQYLAGLLAAADEALGDGVEEISACKFGAVGGNGLLALAASGGVGRKSSGL